MRYVHTVVALLAITVLLAARPLSEVMGSLKLLAAYDIVFVTLATFLFPAVVEQ